MFIYVHLWFHRFCFSLLGEYTRRIRLRPNEIFARIIRIITFGAKRLSKVNE